MFYYLRGEVALIDLGMVVLDCGGVGFTVNTTTNTISKLKPGEETRLFTHCSIREDSFDIYGFYTRQELDTFKLLIAINGVGPKAALAILSSVSPDGLQMAVVTQNEKMLTAAPGVGKKIAQRILLELKDKMARESGGELDFSGGKGAPAAAVFSNKATEAAQALAVLGYTSAEVSMALKGVDVEGLPLEEIIRQSLKKMVK